MPKRKVLKCQHIAFRGHGFCVLRIVDERSELCKNRPYLPGLTLTVTCNKIADSVKQRLDCYIKSHL